MSSDNPIRILLADDHRIVREGLRSLLDNEPDMVVVAEAGDGREAVECAERLRPDVVVTDLSMPGLNGVDATRLIVKGGSQAKVVCLSVHNEQRMLLAALRAGAAGYLVKNCAVRELAQAVRAVAKGETFISSAVAAGLVEKFVGGEAEAQGGAFTALTAREREVLQLLAEGLTSKQVGARLGIAQKTALVHRRNIMEKLAIYSDAELALYALREGLADL